MKKALIVVAALATTAGVWKWRSSGSETHESDSKLAYNRLWIDHMPRTERDVINIFAMIESESLGVFQATSAWRGNFELFRYEGHGEEVRIVYPQSNEKVKAKAKARKCSDNGFDFCLEVEGTGGRGVKKYYSFEGWEIENKDAIQHRIDAIEHAVVRDE